LAIKSLIGLEISVSLLVTKVINHVDETVNFYGILYNDPVHVRDCFNEKVVSHDESLAYLVSRIEKKWDKEQTLDSDWFCAAMNVWVGRQ